MEQILHKTLIIRFSSVGDIVLSSLLIRCIRNRFPECQIDYLVRSEYADLVRHNPRLSRILEFPAGGTFRDLTRLRRSTRNAGYDLIIDIHDSLRSRFLCFGRRNVVRLRKRKFARFMLVRFKIDLYHLFGGSPSVAVRYLEPLASYGVADDGGGLEIGISPAASDAVDTLLQKTGVAAGIRIIGVCPSAQHATKIWPADRFAEVAARLAAETPAAIALFGTAQEQPACEQVARHVRSTSPLAAVLNFAGTLTLAETVAMIARCELILCNDTGLMHVAAACKRKVVAVFGSTVRQFGFYRSVRKLPLMSNHCFKPSTIPLMQPSSRRRV